MEKGKQQKEGDTNSNKKEHFQHFQCLFKELIVETVEQTRILTELWHIYAYINTMKWSEVQRTGAPQVSGLSEENFTVIFGGHGGLNDSEGRGKVMSLAEAKGKQLNPYAPVTPSLQTSHGAQPSHRHTPMHTGCPQCRMHYGVMDL